MEAQAKDAQAQLDAGIKQSLEKVSPANLAANKIDMVIFANTTGDLPLPDKDGFIKWIEDGHAFAAMHSGSDTGAALEQAIAIGGHQRARRKIGGRGNHGDPHPVLYPALAVFKGPFGGRIAFRHKVVSYNKDMHDAWRRGGFREGGCVLSYSNHKKKPKE